MEHGHLYDGVANFLKQCAKKNSIDLSYLRPWDSVLQRPSQSIKWDKPTATQQANPNCLFSLIWRTKQELLKLGLKDGTIQHYASEGFGAILRKHSSLGLENYSESLTEEMSIEICELYHNGQAGRGAYKNLRKATALLSEMYHTGSITLEPLKKWGMREPMPEFKFLLQHFCEHMVYSGALSKSTIKNGKSAIRKFLFTLEECNFKDFSDITFADVNKSITLMANDYNGGLGFAMFVVRKFLKYLYENSFTTIDFSLAMPETIARRTNFREGFSSEETELILAAPNRETSLGKRDFAMMLLATQTGLRLCDIVNLKRENIDWRTKEIRITQRKTGNPISLPLPVESGNAIADYLLHGRQESDLPYIFLCSIGARKPISNCSGKGIIRKYLKIAEIVSPIPRRGFHSFRRSFGTNLLQNEIPFELLQQLLGHSNMDSLKPYLSVDEQNLKKCALELASIRKAGEQA